MHKIANDLQNEDIKSKKVINYSSTKKLV